MENKVKRPWSVWIAQVFFVYCICATVLSFLLATMSVPQAERDLGRLLLIMLINAIFVGLFAMAFWGMAERRPYGRWLGIGLIAFMIIFMNFSPVLLAFTPKHSIGVAVQVLLSILLLVVILHLWISDKIDVFFARKVKSAPIQPPPPPPTFDT